MSAVVTVGQKENSQISVAIQLALCVIVKKKKQIAKPKATKLKKKYHTKLVSSASFRYKK